MALAVIALCCVHRSLDRFKRRSGFPSLRAYFEAAYGGEGSPTFAEAQQRFACSLAAYSVACYVLSIKDRHNGNILLQRVRTCKGSLTLD